MRRSGHSRDSTAVEGECGLSRQPAGRPGDAAARQSQLVRVLTGGAGHIGKKRHVGIKFCRPMRLCGIRADRTTILESDDERADGHFARVQSVEAMRRCRHYAGADFWKERGKSLVPPGRFCEIVRRAGRRGAGGSWGGRRADVPVP